MASISVNNDTVVVSCGEKVLAICGNGVTMNMLEPPGLVGKYADKVESDEDTKTELNTPASAVCVDLSRCNRWLVVCSSNKQLSLWSTDNWSLISNRVIARTASRAKFTPSGRGIVVADKSGDVYLFSVANPDSGGKFLLGHLSMLLDVLITEDEHNIITCDRDEKIRVSRFPNSYNIESFCLGHTEFVSCIAVLPHCSTVLVSSSGDGSLRLWNYATGCQLNMTECSKNVQQYCSSGEGFKQDAQLQADGAIGFFVDGSLQQPNKNTLAVTSFCSCALSNGSSLIAACIATFNGIAVFQAKGGMSNITVHLLEVIFIGVEPWVITLSGMVLWCLAAKEKEPLSAFKFNGNTFFSDPILKNSKDERVHGVVSFVNSRWELFKNISPPSLTSILYKRTVDNLQEYQEKKKARLASSAS